MDKINEIIAGFDFQLIAREVISVVVILIATRIITALVRKAMMKIPKKSHKMTPMLAGLITRVLNLLIWAFAVISMLQTIGLDLTPVITGLGVTGVVLGFALQESIASFFAGFLIALNNPFRKGDYVSIGGTEGTVESMDLMCVVLHTSDNKEVTLANRNVWGSTIVNYSDTGKRRLDITIGVAYGTDLDKATAVFGDILRGYPEVLREPGEEITIEVKALSASSIDFVIRPWVKTDDYWNVLWRFNRDVAKALPKAGIEIPYNKLDVNIVNHPIL